MTRHDPSRPFQLIWWQQPQDQLRLWELQARQQKISADLADALEDLTNRLSHDPVDFGDIFKKYKQIDAAEYRGLIPQWFTVWYGVEHAAKVVIVRKIQAAPGSKLF